MPTPKKGTRFGGSPAHQRLIMSNLATSLFEHRRITTTEAKARALRPIAEKLITRAKKAELGTVESIHHRRGVLRTIRDKSVVHTLFTEIAPQFAERPGGYTRITKIGPRKGDNAPMAVIELVTESYTPKAATRPAQPSRTAAPARTEPEAATVADTEPETTGAEAEGEALPAGAHAPLADENEAPEGFPIKGNKDSMKFHEPDGQWFEQTVAELWFDTPESAEAAGYERAGGDA